MCDWFNGWVYILLICSHFSSSGSFLGFLVASAICRKFWSCFASDFASVDLLKCVGSQWMMPLCRHPDSGPLQSPGLWIFLSLTKANRNTTVGTYLSGIVVDYEVDGLCIWTRWVSEICNLLFRTNHSYIFVYPHDQVLLQFLHHLFFFSFLQPMVSFVYWFRKRVVGWQTDSGYGRNEEDKEIEQKLDTIFLIFFLQPVSCSMNVCSDWMAVTMTKEYNWWTQMCVIGHREHLNSSRMVQHWWI
jgi:hypothetical protein